MTGAILGDIAGSRFEFSKPSGFNYKKVELFGNNCFFTDDTVLTIATKYALLNDISYAKAYGKFGRMYRDVGYGTMFQRWLDGHAETGYGSFGNGAAMRVSYIAYHFDTLEKVEEEAKNSAMCTHNHIEGLKAAVATAGLIYLALHGERKKDLKNTLTKSLNTPCISRCGRTGRRRSLMLRRRGPCRLRSAALWKARIGKAASAMCSA